MTKAPKSLRKVVSGFILNSSGAVLICQRPKHKYNGGQWEFPGGKLESGETEAEALKRELREELDVKVTEVSPILFTQQDGPYIISIVKAKIEGTPRNLEHPEIRWIDIIDLPKVTLTPVNHAYMEEMDL